MALTMVLHSDVLIPINFKFEKTLIKEVIPLLLYLFENIVA